MCHYDFETKPLNVYPKAHVQVSGTSPALDQLRTKRPDMEAHKLGELHFPVGGRRFRPTLEDVIEMLIVEGIADARPDWESVIAEHRKRWREIQLRAAVRRWPEWAAAALTDLGCQVEGLPQLLAKQRAESAN